MPRPKLEKREKPRWVVPKAGGRSEAWRPSANRMALRTTMIPTLTNVVQFCRSELLRVPQTLTAVTIAIMATEATVDAMGERGTISARKRVKARARAAI